MTNKATDKHLTGTWKEFESWIRETIGSDFRWCLRPMDTYQNRAMIANIILVDIENGKGIVLGKNAFLELL